MSGLESFFTVVVMIGTPIVFVRFLMCITNAINNKKFKDDTSEEFQKPAISDKDKVLFLFWIIGIIAFCFMNNFGYFDESESEEVVKEYVVEKMSRIDVVIAIENNGTVSGARNILNDNGYSLTDSFPVNNDRWTRETYQNGQGDKISFTIAGDGGWDRYLTSVD